MLPDNKGESSAPQSCCLLPPSRIHPLIPRLLGPVLRISGREKRMSLFSLLTLSITKNSPQDEQGQTPLSPSQSCASENGMDTAEWESHPLLPLLHSAPRCRAGGGTLLAAAETPGCLGDLDSETGAGGDRSTAEWGSLSTRAPCPRPQPSHSLLP